MAQVADCEDGGDTDILVAGSTNTIVVDPLTASCARCDKLCSVTATDTEKLVQQLFWTRDPRAPPPNHRPHQLLRLPTHDQLRHSETPELGLWLYHEECWKQHEQAYNDRALKRYGDHETTAVDAAQHRYLAWLHRLYDRWLSADHTMQVTPCPGLGRPMSAAEVLQCTGDAKGVDTLHVPGSFRLVFSEPELQRDPLLVNPTWPMQQFVTRCIVFRIDLGGRRKSPTEYDSGVLYSCAQKLAEPYFTKQKLEILRIFVGVDTGAMASGRASYHVAFIVRPIALKPFKNVLDLIDGSSTMLRTREDEQRWSKAVCDQLLVQQPSITNLKPDRTSTVNVAANQPMARARVLPGKQHNHVELCFNCSNDDTVYLCKRQNQLLRVKPHGRFVPCQVFTPRDEAVSDETWDALTSSWLGEPLHSDLILTSA